MRSGLKSEFGEASKREDSDAPAIAVVILAAGASTRMGTPKQLLPYREHSFLCHAAEVAVASSCRPVIVVLGAHAKQIYNQVSHPVQVVENPNWSEGMSTSIWAGIQALNALPKKPEAVILMLCDQPFVSTQTIQQLVEAHRMTGKPVVASEYAGTLGVPALFSRTLFPQLLDLKEGEGAKQVIKKYAHQVFGVPFPAGAIDIDTPKDYEQFQLMTGLKLPASSSSSSKGSIDGEVSTEYQ